MENSRSHEPIVGRGHEVIIDVRTFNTTKIKTRDLFSFRLNRRLGIYPVHILHEILLRTAIRWRLGGKQSQPVDHHLLQKLRMVVKEIGGARELENPPGQHLAA